MENPWIETPKGGSTSRTTTPPKSFAAAAATKPKIMAPQQRYDNIPTTRFMAPMPKKPVTKQTGNFGKHYMVRFHRNEKPLKGTAMLIQAVVSEIN